MLTNWKARALAAEALVAASDAAIAEAQAQLATVQRIHADRAALVSMVVEGRTLRFTFARNGVLTVCETYCTMDQDVAGWRSALLDRQPTT